MSAGCGAVAADGWDDGDAGEGDAGGGGAFGVVDGAVIPISSPVGAEGFSNAISAADSRTPPPIARLHSLSEP